MQVDGEYEARHWMRIRIESITGMLDIRWDLYSTSMIGELYSLYEL